MTERTTLIELRAREAEWVRQNLPALRATFKAMAEMRGACWDRIHAILGERAADREG